MIDKFINIIESLGYPVYRQGSLSDTNDYDDSFFTFWNNETADVTFYDDTSHTVFWSFDLNFYSTDIRLVNKELVEAKKKLLKEGFIIDGVGHDVMSDRATHTGRGINVIKIEEQEDNK